MSKPRITDQKTNPSTGCLLWIDPLSWHESDLAPNPLFSFTNPSFGMPPERQESPAQDRQVHWCESSA